MPVATPGLPAELTLTGDHEPAALALCECLGGCELQIQLEHRRDSIVPSGLGVVERIAMSVQRDVDWYSSQSPITDPGGHAALLEDVPSGVDELRRTAHGLVIHYRVDQPLEQGIPAGRLREIDSRYAETMLFRLAELQGGSLRLPRDLERRLVGCCRDFTVLFLMMARHRGIPCRARVGFARYFVPKLGLDHEVAEVWDSSERRWRLIDAELSDEHVDPTDGAVIDPLDVPRDRFLVAGQAFGLCRTGEADPQTFMVDPGLDLETTRGWPYLQHNLVHDLAALTKIELLLWDAWGLADQPASARDLDLLDRLAKLTSSPDPALGELRELAAADPRLPVPRTVTSYDPLGGPARVVELSALARCPG